MALSACTRHAGKEPPDLDLHAYLVRLHTKGLKDECDGLPIVVEPSVFKVLSLPIGKAAQHNAEVRRQVASLHGSSGS